MSKQRPILFSTAMVQAILAGRKTQTRRVVKPQPESVNAEAGIPVGEYLDKLRSLKDKGLEHVRAGTNGMAFPKCPYGQPGDVLWVRETWMRLPREGFYAYKASHPSFKEGELKNNLLHEYGFRWKPSIHMPKEACRLFLRVKNVRVERLQDISDADACEEGIEPVYFEKNFDKKAIKAFKHYTDSSFDGADAIGSFRSLWQSINGEQSWRDNPWVWVREFERMEAKP